LKYHNIPIGKSLFDEESLGYIENIYKQAKFHDTNIILPIDFKGEMNHLGSKKYCHAKKDSIDKNMVCQDIGEESFKLFHSVLNESSTIVWNGTLGVAENKIFAEGTNSIIDFIASNELTSIVGGGDTVAAIRNYNEDYINEFSHVSTGGGSCLELLSGNKLPAIEILR